MATEVFMDKAAFIQHELEALVKRVDEDIYLLRYTPTADGKDVSTVDINYKNGGVIRVNVECDSLGAITKDVLRAIM